MEKAAQVVAAVTFIYMLLHRHDANNGAVAEDHRWYSAEDHRWYSVQDVSSHSMNVFVKKETTQTVIVDSFHLACSQLEKHSKNNNNTLLHFQMDNKTCHPGSMGNSLAQIYKAELVSKLAGAELDVGCNKLNDTTRSVQ